MTWPRAHSLGAVEPGFDLKHTDFKTIPLDTTHCLRSSLIQTVLPTLLSYINSASLSEDSGRENLQ